MLPTMHATVPTTAILEAGRRSLDGEATAEPPSSPPKPPSHPCTPTHIAHMHIHVYVTMHAPTVASSGTSSLSHTLPLVPPHLIPLPVMIVAGGKTINIVYDVCGVPSFEEE